MSVTNGAHMTAPVWMKSCNGYEGKAVCVLTLETYKVAAYPWRKNWEQWQFPETVWLWCEENSKFYCRKSNTGPSSS
jgi:hypothetical protein